MRPGGAPHRLAPGAAAKGRKPGGHNAKKHRAPEGRHISTKTFMSYTTCYYHVIFHTLHNVPAIDTQHEETLYKYIWGLCQNKGVFLHQVGGTQNHLHLLVDLPPQLSLADFVKILKVSTNHWLKGNQLFPLFAGWASGYAGLSYAKEDIPNIINYIKNQKQHHCTISWEEELRLLFDKHGIKLNEDYFRKDWLE